MDKPLRDALQMILDQLCIMNKLLRKCCEAPSCQPAAFPAAFPQITTKVLSTIPQPLLGTNPNRLAFTVMNGLNSQKIYLSPFAQPAASAVPTLVVAANTSQPVTAYTVPASITGDWYAWADSGTPTISIQEELKE